MSHLKLGEKLQALEKTPPIGAIIRMIDFDRQNLSINQSVINNTDDGIMPLYGNISFEKKNIVLADMIIRIVFDPVLSLDMSKIITQYRGNF